MTITQYQAGSTGVAVGVMPATKAKRPKRKVDKKANRRQRLERTLDESLKETESREHNAVARRHAEYIGGDKPSSRRHRRSSIDHSSGHVARAG